MARSPSIPLQHASAPLQHAINAGKQQAHHLVALALRDEEDVLEVDGEVLLVELQAALDLRRLTGIAEHKAVQHQQLQLQQCALRVLLDRLAHQILHEDQICSTPRHTPMSPRRLPEHAEWQIVQQDPAYLGYCDCGGDDGSGRQRATRARSAADSPIPCRRTSQTPRA
eukprot:3235814-Rhodomonas_salina.5